MRSISGRVTKLYYLDILCHSQWMPSANWLGGSHNFQRMPEVLLLIFQCLALASTGKAGDVEEAGGG